MAIQTKIISGNGLNQGAVIQAPKAAGVDAYGTNYTVNHIINKDMGATDRNTQLDDHLDNPRYYTGDTVN